MKSTILVTMEVPFLLAHTQQRFIILEIIYDGDSWDPVVVFAQKGIYPTETIYLNLTVVSPKEFWGATESYDLIGQSLCMPLQAWILANLDVWIQRDVCMEDTFTQNRYNQVDRKFTDRGWEELGVIPSRLMLKKGDIFKFTHHVLTTK
ncbi:hypothetical protein ACJX0J_035145, partial [Zea mays]